MPFVIGVDGGGTKTEAVAFDLSGRELARSRSGFANVLVDPERAIKHIREAIEGCIHQVKDRCLYLYLGLAGIESGTCRAELEKMLRERFAIPFSIVNDAQIAHAGALRGGDGILTVAGTGSICFGVKEGVQAVTGGWGNLLGDEGSGYWIAIQALRRIIAEAERNLPHSPLSRCLLDEIGVKEAEGLKSFVYGVTKAEIAGLAPIVARQADSGDEASAAILRRAGRELVQMTLRLREKLGFGDDVSIAVAGSILCRISHVRETFLREIRQSIVNARVAIAGESAAKGGYYLAMRRLGERG
ncbi:MULTISPECIES: N-acetylglucosamine kinase [Thermoactinomyces]|jgi:N-acetylglucosamine kinase-like BadF-type ATPase|uniref:ATPase n=1 Tax=Thermoactinomyces daqus TaxID=1329516 RepID=A0A7W1XDK1_9BACL|nr:MULTISPECIES: BadF/BadG/BcrA/BcrD ATPase family protein [Thermoactinomyces]MBA4544638.1 ATPase [Thermoactinomyces daqus]MBH8609306.1 ATPase [Thermoactinomyces sp. CICC 10521]